MSLEIALTHLGHSCVLLEVPAASGNSRILLDPGSLAPDLQTIEGLDAILVTHAHPDHLTADQVRAARGASDAPLYGDSASVAMAAESGLNELVTIEPGELQIAGIKVSVTEWQHETIYPGIPLPTDYGYLLADRVFAPGDAFAVPDFKVDVLLLPTGAPWMKLSEAVDYLRAVAPRIAIPVHDGGLAPAHQQMHRGIMQKFAPEGTTVLTPEIGEAITV